MRSSTDIDLILGRHKRKANKQQSSDSDETKDQSNTKINRDEESGKHTTTSLKTRQDLFCGFNSKEC